MHHKQPNLNHHSTRRGVTLVELMVVVSILVLLFAVALPQMRPSLEQTKLREGARLANAAFGRARVRAIETGNPVGLVVEPTSNSGACLSLAFAQIPTLYGGSTTNSTVSIDGDGEVTFSVSGDAAEIAVGDMIKFDYQGKKYRVADNGASGDVWQFTDEGNDVDLQMSGAKFQVFKRPFRSKQTIPTPLPKGICVDIAASGLGDGNFLAGQTIIVLFNSAGLVEQVYVGDQAITPTSPIYLLVGETATLGTAEIGEFWIACGHQTGSIITADVAEFDATLMDSDPVTPAVIPAIVQSRQYAREKKMKGGR